MPFEACPLKPGDFKEDVKIPELCKKQCGREFSSSQKEYDVMHENAEEDGCKVNPLELMLEPEVVGESIQRPDSSGIRYYSEHELCPCCGDQLGSNVYEFNCKKTESLD